MDQQLIEMLRQASAVMKHAYVPHSHFPVGACLRTVDQRLFIGCNAENASFSLTWCAEAAALAAMVSAGGKCLIRDIVIVAAYQDNCPPCGSCRQRLAEFSTPETVVHLGTQTAIKQTITLETLLPFAFVYPGEAQK